MCCACGCSPTHLALVVAQDLVAPVGDGIINVIMKNLPYGLRSLGNTLDLCQ